MAKTTSAVAAGSVQKAGQRPSAKPWRQCFACHSLDVAWVVYEADGYIKGAWLCYEHRQGNLSAGAPIPDATWKPMT